MAAEEGSESGTAAGKMSALPNRDPIWRGFGTTALRLRTGQEYAAQGDGMELLAVLPWVVILAGAFYIVRFAKSLGRELPKRTLAPLGVLAIVVPVVAQGVAAAVFSPPLRYTKLVWFFIDTFGMRGGNAQFCADVFCRTMGALVGITLVTIPAGIVLQ